ncbi:thaumatin, partial [Geopyxis carbonaria]
MAAANNPHAAPWSLTFKNNCPFHLWPGINDNAATGVRAVGPVRGFELPPAAVVTHTMPPNWGGRVWARQGCQFQNGCMVGGDPGVTLFEITSNDALSTYWDLSGVDGHSLDMAVQPRARNGTPLPKVVCEYPAHHYHLPNAGTGLPMLRPCLSRCTRYNQDIDCCRGAYGTPDTCPMNKYAKRLAHLCPDMYSYAYGDRMATFTHPQNTVYDFEITFCP